MRFILESSFQRKDAKKQRRKFGLRREAKRHAAFDARNIPDKLYFADAQKRGPRYALPPQSKFSFRASLRLCAFALNFSPLTTIPWAGNTSPDGRSPSRWPACARNKSSSRQT